MCMCVVYIQGVTYVMAGRTFNNITNYEGDTVFSIWIYNLHDSQLLVSFD